MKIKCPICDFTGTEKAELEYHLGESHELMSYVELAKLIFKIHEKMEVYRTEGRGSISDAKFLAMKSLLEYEK